MSFREISKCAKSRMINYMKLGVTDCTCNICHIKQKMANGYLWSLQSSQLNFSKPER